MANLQSVDWSDDSDDEDSTRNPRRSQTLMDLISQRVDLAREKGQKVSDDYLVQFRDETLDLMPVENQHQGQVKLINLMVFAIIWWLTKYKEDFKQAPLAVAREQLKTEHDHYVRNMARLERQRQNLDEEKARLREEKINFAAEKKIIRSLLHEPINPLQEALRTQFGFFPEEKESSTTSLSQEGNTGGKQQQENREVTQNTSSVSVTSTSITQALPQPNINDKPTVQQPENPKALPATAEQEQTNPILAPRDPRHKPSWSSLEFGIRTAIDHLSLHIIADQTRAPNILNINVKPALVIERLSKLYRIGKPSEIENWRTFEREADPGKWYCWYGVINHGKDRPDVKDGKCVCVRWTEGYVSCSFRNGGSDCVLVKRNVAASGKGKGARCSFVWKRLWREVEYQIGMFVYGFPAKENGGAGSDGDGGRRSLGDQLR